MFKLRLVLLAVLAAALVQAFIPPLPKGFARAKVSETLAVALDGSLLLLSIAFCGLTRFPSLLILLVQRQPLFAAPQPNLLTQADKCLGGECSIDDVSGACVCIGFGPGHGRRPSLFHMLPY